jgi:hypothetical protein
MAQSLDIFIDVTNGNLVAAGSAGSGTLPTLTRNDSYNLRVRLQERDSGGFLRDLDTTGSSIKLGIGGIDDGPSDGAFKLTINSITSNAITWSSDEATVASRIFTAVSNNVSTCNVYGLEPDAYLLTATQPNTAMSFGGSGFTLFPTSSVLVSTRRFPAPSVQAQQVVKLRRNPAVYSDSFVASSVSGVVSLTRTQVGSTTFPRNETYNLAVGADAEGGSIVLSYNNNTTTAIQIGSSAASFAEALTAVTGIGANNVSVDSGNNTGDYSISFVRALGSQALPYSLVLDSTGVIYGNYLRASVTMATSELDELFAEAGTDTISPTIEIELTQNGTPKTIYQGTISVRRDLITTGAVVPADQASYYTKAETNALFVEDSSSNVDATNRILSSADSAYSVDYGSRILYDNIFNPIVAWSDGGASIGGSFTSVQTTCLGFFSSNPITKPTGTNIVSGLTNLGLISYTQPTAVNVVSSLIDTGLIASGATYGVLPQSPRTLTAVTYTTFGLVPSNNVISKTVTITGCQLNDIVLLGLPADIEEGLAFSGHVVTANQIHIDALNVTGSGKTQNATTFRITVIGY